MKDILQNKNKALIFIFIVILIFGINAYMNIPKELNPDIEIPGFNIVIPYQGISAEDAEKLLSKPMEKNLSSLEGLKNITSYSTNDHSFVYLEFYAGINTKKVLQDVREKVSQTKSELPTEADEPVINEYNFSLMPVISVILNGDVPKRNLNQIALNLKDEIKEISEVLEVDLIGYDEELIEILIKPEVLQTYNLRIADIENIVRSKDQIIAGGRIINKNGNYSLKVAGMIKNYQELLRLPVKLEDNRIITLREIAEVRSTFVDATKIARVDGRNSISLEIVKRSGENVIETINKVKKAVEEYDIPKEIEVKYSQDSSKIIQERLDDLENNVLLAIILAVVPVIFTMGITSANLVAISIPGSFLLGVLYLYMTGNSFNIVVLFSLVLSVGMLVDATIVVCEYADRKMIEGVSYKQAYFIASRRMFIPIFSSTLTTLVVFLPLLFWPGIVGKFMYYLPTTVIATVGSSCLVALVFIPVIGSFIGNKKNVNNEMQKAIDISEGKGSLEDLTGLNKLYYKSLRFCLDKAGLTVSVIIGILIISIVIFKFSDNGVEFFPNIDPDNIQIQVEAEGNLSLEQKDEIAKKIEKKLAVLGKEFKVIYSRIGSVSSTKGNVIDKINLELADWQTRRKADEIIYDIRSQLSDLNGIKYIIQKEKKGPGGEKDIEIELTGVDKESMKKTADILYQYLLKDPELRDIENSNTVKKIEWVAEIDETKAGLIGLTKGEIGNALKLVSNGINLAKYRPDYLNYEVDVKLRFTEDFRNVSSLENLFIINNYGEAVPIINAVELKPAKEAGVIIRKNNKNIETIKANVAENIVPSNKILTLQKEISDLKLDPAVKVEFAGEEEDKKETGEFLKNAFTTALLLMLVILILQFNSYYKAFIIMTAIFLSTAGVLLGLIITAQPFGIVMCGIGIIALAGTVVNNNIIFIDAFEELNNKLDLSIEDILVRTGLQRIRPILLTAGTTSLGLLPMILGVSFNILDLSITIGSPSSKWWTQLSTTIAGGLAFATVLTLFFTPCLLKLGHKANEKIHNMRGKLNGKNTSY